jgi:hypothetical protein
VRESITLSLPNNMRIDLTDSDIVARLSNLEDSFIERKTGDSGDWLKTVIVGHGRSLWKRHRPASEREMPCNGER